MTAPCSKTPTPIAGIKIGTACAQIKQSEHDDMVIFALDIHSTTAAVFTRNAFCAAPVTIARRHLASVNPRYLIVNSGNANAGTGQRGLHDAIHCCEKIAQQSGCTIHEVLPFSTGVIGVPLPVEKIALAIPDAWQNLAETHWHEAARAIMTTDTVPKIASIQETIQGQTVTITGIAKGAGMIRPQMATMLAFIATDAALPTSLLQKSLQQAVDASFNRMTIDGDTSTNDACVLVATGQGTLKITDRMTIDGDTSTNDACVLVATGQGTLKITDSDETALTQFTQTLTTLCTQLAQAIVRDGEGATKFITVKVEQGFSESECLEVAYTIAHSPLVKTAFFASDANWGRILAAVGRANLPNLKIDQVQIYLGDVCIVERGGVAANYTETLGHQVMQAIDITIKIVLNRGSAQAEIWTCDFSYDYVRINAEYRT